MSGRPYAGGGKREKKRDDPPRERMRMKKSIEKKIGEKKIERYNEEKKKGAKERKIRMYVCCSQSLRVCALNPLLVVWMTKKKNMMRRMSFNLRGHCATPGIYIFSQCQVRRKNIAKERIKKSSSYMRKHTKSQHSV